MNGSAWTELNGKIGFMWPTPIDWTQESAGFGLVWFVPLLFSGAPDKEEQALHLKSHLSHSNQQVSK